MAGKFLIGWRQVLACMILQAVGAAMIASAFSVIAVPLAKEFHPPRAILMLAMTVMAGVSGLLSPFLGKLMDRISLKTLMFVGSGILVLGYVALSFATSFTQVLLVYGLIMAPANILVGTMASQVLISRWFANRRGTALGIAVAGISMGGIIFPPIISGLIDTLEWRMAFRALAGIIALFTFPAVAMIVNQPSDRGLFPDGAASDPEITITRAAPKISTKALLTDPTFWFIAAILSSVLAGMKGMVTNLVTLATDQGVSPTDAAWLISTYAASGFVGKLGFASISDRVNLRILIFISLGGFAIGMAFLAQAQTGYAAIALAAAILGMFGGLMVPLEGMMVARIYGRQFVGQVAGLLNLFLLTALLTTPPLFGLVFDLTGSYNAVFYLFIGFALCAMLLVPRIRLQPRGVEPATPAIATPLETPLGPEPVKG